MSYEAIARLGRGGMGVVDLARDGGGNRVALKRLVLHGSAAEIAAARQRLLREADVLRRLHHRNVVRLVDVIDDGDEIVLVMPYLAGGTLAERVAEHGPAPSVEVERLGRRLLGALVAAHRAGIVHRDIKPANVLFDSSGEPCLADFGVAHSRDQTQGLTVAGTVVGTPAFMSPEQARGEPVSPATDVFSLGATLLFAASGSGPYGTGEPGLLMVRAAAGKVERIPKGVPASLRNLLERMLEPRPERRPSAAALLGGPGGAVIEPPRRTPRSRRRWLVRGGIAAGVALVTGAVVSGAARSNDPAAGSDQAQPVDCRDRPYQPCGQSQPAPFTDGVRCVDDHDDYDGDPTNGCEAAPDGVEGAELVDSLDATIVPRRDSDSFKVRVDDRFNLFCNGTLVLTLRAPDGMPLRLEVKDGGESLGVVRTDGGRRATLTLRESACIGDDGGTLDAVVTPVGTQRVAERYTLTRRGSF